MYLIVVFLPLISFLVCGLFGFYIGSKGSNLLSCFCIGICCIFSSLIFFEVGLAGSFCFLELNTWINSGLFHICWGFLFDSLTVSMFTVVITISFLVHLYSTSYMIQDPHSTRFMAYLSIFTFFMLLLVSSNNLLQMFIGWEGVGLSSYLLINFWHTRLAANQSAIKALLINRIGDFGLVLSILLIFYTFYTLNYAVIFSMVPLLIQKEFIFFNITLSCFDLIGIFLCLGAFGKSAQLGLHSWLPDAMEGPTPVSALIHAATMVTAGVFLIIRFSPLIEYTPNVLFLLVIIGSSTTFFAAIIGVFQNDIKKIIAYSTCSQLGYMVFTCGISQYHVSIFHLLNHAFFKALLFLSAGAIIHVLMDEQDIRKMGSLKELLPLTYSMMFIGTLSLIGFPFLTGFYSKDFILELTQVSTHYNLFKSYSMFSYWLSTISVFFTSFYSFRLIYKVFLNPTNNSRMNFSSVHDVAENMCLPLIILTIGSIFVGYLTKDLFIGVGTNFWQGSLFTLPKYSVFFEAEFISPKVKFYPFILTLLGFLFATWINIYVHYVYKFMFKWKKLSWYICVSLSKKLYLDNLYNQVFALSLLKFGYNISFKSLDKGFFEWIGPSGISLIVQNGSQRGILLQTGQITHYIFFILLGLIFSFFVQISSLYLFFAFPKYLFIINFMFLVVFLK